MDKLEEKAEEIYMDKITKMIAHHEGLKLTMYLDTVGVPTIGYGHNLNEPISDLAALQILKDDIRIAISELDREFDWWRKLPDKAQNVLISMAFNLGLPRLKKFEKFLTALENQDFKTSAKEMEDSLWFRQVKTRGVELRDMMLSINEVGN